MKQEYSIIFMIALVIFQRLTLVIHEFGHAMATLYKSKENVTVYIGSYGNPENSFRFQIKRLKCFIKYNVFKWKGGLCIPHGENNSWKDAVIITLFGPLTTCIVGIISGLFLLFFELHDALKMILFALTFTCLLDFFYNIIPRKSKVKLHDGTRINNDGKRLLYLWKTRNIHQLNMEAIACFNSKEFAKSARLFERCLKKVNNDKELYQLAITSYLAIKNYKKAIELHEVYSKNYKNAFDAYDFVNLGVIHLHTEDFDDALDLFNHAAKIMPNTAVILNNIGFTLGLMENHVDAIKYLDMAIIADKEHAFSLNNRGYSKIRLGQLENGLVDIQKSLEFDDQNSYTYRNLGLYFFYKKDYLQALEFYEQAKKLDITTHKIQNYIDEVNVFLNK